MSNTLTLSDIRLDVQDGMNIRTILDIPSFILPGGTCLGIRGSSGAGKSTFLKVISGITLPTTGTVRFGNTTVNRLPEGERDRWRGRNIGFLFQDFRLFDGLSALDNVLLPFTFTRRTISRAVRAEAAARLTSVGVRPETTTENLSRGEMQRTALVRVLMQSPRLILADEPTASLDSDWGEQAVEALIDVSKQLNASLLLVSHDERILSHFDNIITLKNGRLTGGSSE